jgi:hypothetical protein
LPYVKCSSNDDYCQRDRIEELVIIMMMDALGEKIMDFKIREQTN